MKFFSKCDYIFFLKFPCLTIGPDPPARPNYWWIQKFLNVNIINCQKVDNPKKVKIRVKRGD